MSLSPIDREYGNLQMSIATSLAFEGLLHLGEHEGAKGEPPVHKYQTVLINLRTLFRNAYNAFGDNKGSVTADVALAAIEEDLRSLRETVSAVSPSTVCAIYLCEYQSLMKKFPQGKFYSPNTPAQVHFHSVEQDVYKMVKNGNLPDVEYFDTDLKGNHDTAILTHLPVDLLSREEFPKLALLESHTGAVKTHLEWNTRLNGKPDYVPFNRIFLQVYGDKVMFAPGDLKSRRVLEKTADKFKWSADTTMSRIYQTLQIANEPFLIEYLKRLAR